MRGRVVAGCLLVLGAAVAVWCWRVGPVAPATPAHRDGQRLPAQRIESTDVPRIDATPPIEQGAASAPEATAPAAASTAPEQPCVVLHVYDRISGRELSDVIVDRHFPPDDEPDPTNFVATGPSPLRIPAGEIYEEGSTWSVSARGFSREALPIKEPAEREIWLSPAGDVEILVPRVPTGVATTVQLRRHLDLRVKPPGTSDGRWQDLLSNCIDGERSDWAVAGAPHRFRGVAVGSYHANLELGDGAVLVTAPVEVVPGTVTRVELHLPSHVDTPPRTAVTIRVSDPGDDATPERRWFVRFRTDAKDAIWNAPRAREWHQCEQGLNPSTLEPINLVPGRYVVRIEPFAYETTIEVAGAPEQVVDIVLPEMPLVSFRVESAETHEVLSRPIFGSGPMALNVDLDDRLLSPGPVRLAAGKHRVWAYGDDESYGYVSADVTVLPGRTTEVVLRSPPLRGIAIGLQENGNDLPFDGWHWSVELRDNEGCFVDRYRTSDGLRALIEPTRAGTYTLLVEDVDDYEPIPPRSVTITDRGWTKVTIAVRRRR